MKNNKIKEVINIMLAGVSQVTFNTRPLCGLLLLVALAVASPYLLVSCLWSVAIATAAIYALKLPKEAAKQGLYTINSALAGVAVPLSAYKFPLYEENMLGVLILTACVSVLSVILTHLLKKRLDPLGASPLAIPYSIALAVMSIVCTYTGCLSTDPLFGPTAFKLHIFEDVTYAVADIITALLHGAAQIFWIEDVPTAAVAGVIVLIAILTASRSDFLITVYAVIVSTAVAVIFGIDQGGVMLGLYGFGGALMGLALLNITFEKNKRTLLLITGLLVINVFFTAILKAGCTAIGISVAAFAWAVLTITVMIIKNKLSETCKKKS